MAEKTGSGMYIHSVAFDRRTDADDGLGNYQAGFAEVFRTRAAYVPMRGSEAVIAARLEGVQPVAVRLRVSDNSRQIRADWQMRDLHDGTAYAVRSVIQTERKYVDLLVESGVAA